MATTNGKPAWLNLSHVKLASILSDVWQRIPPEARAMATADPIVFTLAHDHADYARRVDDPSTLLRTMLTTEPNRPPTIHIVAHPDVADLSAPVVRYLVAHELSHAVLRHFDRAYFAADIDVAAVRHCDELAADWLVTQRWGFADEARAWVVWARLRAALGAGFTIRRNPVLERL